MGGKYRKKFQISLYSALNQCNPFKLIHESPPAAQKTKKKTKQKK